MATCLVQIYEGSDWTARRNSIRKNMPVCFRRKSRNYICIIDCNEICTEKPSNLGARANI